MVWANGNLYDCVNGAASLIKAGAYTVGQQIGRVDLGGILYYTTVTVPLRQWNGTTEQAVANSGGVGTVPPPSGTVLAAYAGSLICGNPTVSAVNYPGGFIYCNVNDPTTWIGANLNQLGSNEFIMWIIPLGVSAAGVPPTGSFMIGCANQIFVYQGPLNALTQKIVNSPVGAQDPNSAQFVPSQDLFPGIIFLGSDGQFWITNGITTGCISLKILNLVYNFTQNSKLIFAKPRYFAGYNARYQYYICDFGSNVQLVYMTQTKSWWVISGWPSGSIITGHDNAGFPTNFIANTNVGITSGLYQVGIDFTTFNGVNPNVFYQTAYLHGGDPELWKEWQWVFIGTLTVQSTYQVVATGLPLATNTQQSTQPLLFGNPLAPGTLVGAIWDTSLWDQALWTGINTLQTVPDLAHGMLSVAVPVSKWVAKPTTQPLRSSAASFTITWAFGLPNSGTPAFDINQIIARFNPRGRKPVGGATGTAQAGILRAGTDPFVGVNPNR